MFSIKIIRESILNQLKCTYSYIEKGKKKKKKIDVTKMSATIRFFDAFPYCLGHRQDRQPDLTKTKIKNTNKLTIQLPNLTKHRPPNRLNL